MQEYPWYELIEDKQLVQGDILLSCPLISPPSTISPGKNVTADVCEYNVIVMSQSCDLAQGKIQLVLVCPIWEMTDFVKINESYKNDKMKETLRRGNLPGYHLLNQPKDFPQINDYLIVDFRKVFGVDINFLKEFSLKQGARIRLLPPYREHLSQAFARFFMRVGLPIDIPPFKK